MSGSRLSEGTIDGYLRSFADCLKPVHSRLGDFVKTVDICHFDEAVMRVEGSLHWFHIAMNELLCYLWLGKSRGDVMTASICPRPAMPMAWLIWPVSVLVRPMKGRPGRQDDHPII